MSTLTNVPTIKGITNAVAIPIPPMGMINAEDTKPLSNTATIRATVKFILLATIQYTDTHTAIWIAI